MVMTAIAVRSDSGTIRTRIAETRVAFQRLTGNEIDRYARCGEGLGKAGGYAIQGRAEIFVRRLSGSYSNVVGLPLRETVTLLRASGYSC
jgi:septum formation protein